MKFEASYSASVMTRFLAASGVGDPDDEGWFVGEACESLTATLVRVALRVANGAVLEMRYRVRGCPHTVAALERIREQWIGANVSTAGLDPRTLLTELAAPVTKLGRLLTVQAACQEALRAALASA